MNTIIPRFCPAGCGRLYKRHEAHDFCPWLTALEFGKLARANGAQQEAAEDFADQNWSKHAWPAWRLRAHAGKHVVVFRRVSASKHNDVLALFPVARSVPVGHVLCYYAQHSSFILADFKATWKATREVPPENYAPERAELEAKGFQLSVLKWHNGEINRGHD